MTRRVALVAALWLAGCGPETTVTTETGSTTTADSATQTATVGPTATTAGPTTASASSSGSTSTSSASSSSTTACNFVCANDTPDLERCDLFAQDCEEGFKCASYDQDGDGAWDTSICVEIMGDGQAGDPCTGEHGTGLDTCAKGHICWDLDERGQGTCIAHCTGNEENPMCEPDCTWCVISGSAAITLCLPECHPLEDGCFPEETCVPKDFDDGFECVDSLLDNAPIGTPCDDPGGCDVGLVCQDSQFFPHPNCVDSPGCCAPYCDLNEGEGQNPTCDALAPDIDNASCFPLYYGPFCAPEVGLCGVPVPP